MSRQRLRSLRQQGLTLVELLVAVALMLMVTAGSVALYSVNAGSSRTVDASQTLDDTARFVFEILGQAIRNAGYPGAVPGEVNAASGTLRTVVNLFDECGDNADEAPCPILGFDNKKFDKLSKTDGLEVKGSGVNASDVLAVRFNGGSNSFSEGVAGNSDGSMVDCYGNSVVLASEDSQLGWSVFDIRNYKDEPELYCRTLNKEGKRLSQPLARGVESFQAVYGLDCRDASKGCVQDGVPERWVIAADLKKEDWRYVRAVRIGIIVRGSPGSSQVRDKDYLYPLGEEFSTGQSGAGFKFTVPQDSRLRRVYTTTFMLRNAA